MNENSRVDENTESNYQACWGEQLNNQPPLEDIFSNYLQPQIHLS